MKNIRDFNSSAEARAAGFTTRQWLRAFSFAEHAARIDADRARKDAAQAAVFGPLLPR